MSCMRSSVKDVRFTVSVDRCLWWCCCCLRVVEEATAGRDMEMTCFVFFTTTAGVWPWRRYGTCV